MEQIIIDIAVDDVTQKLGETTRMIEELKKSNSDMLKEMRKGNVSWAEGSAKIAENQENIRALTAAQKTYQGQLAYVNQGTKDYEKSLVGMESHLAALRRQYAAMEESMRSGAGGKQLLDSIKQLESQTNKTRASMGQFQQNVGHYQLAMQGIGDAAQMAGGGFSKMSNIAAKAMKTLATNPYIAVVGAALSALVGAANRVREAFKRNDDAGTALKSAMAALQPILTGINKVFDKLAISVANVAGRAADMFTNIMDKIVPGYKLQYKATQDLVKSQDDLEEAERNYAKSSAEISAQVAKAREELYSNRALGNTEERRKAFAQMISQEQTLYKEEKRIAEERLRIHRKSMQDRVDTSDEARNKETELINAVQAAETKYSNIRTANIKEANRLNIEYNASLEETIDRYSRLAAAKGAEETLTKLWAERTQIEAEGGDNLREYLTTLQSINDANERINEIYNKGLMATEDEDKLMKKLMSDVAGWNTRIVELNDASNKQLEKTSLRWVEVVKGIDAAGKAVADYNGKLNTGTGGANVATPKVDTKNIREQFEKLAKDLASDALKAADPEAYAKSVVENTFKKAIEELNDAKKQLEVQGKWSDELQQAYDNAKNDAESIQKKALEDIEKKAKETSDAVKNAEDDKQRAIDKTNQELAKQADQLQKQLDRHDWDSLSKASIEMFDAQKEYNDAYMQYQQEMMWGTEQTHAEAYNRMLAAQIKYTEASKRYDNEIKASKEAVQDAMMKAGQSMTDMFGAMSSMMDENSASAKAFALLQIAAQSAVAIASAVAGATEASLAGGPAAPYLLIAYVASMIATVVAGIAQAKAQLEGFAEGGIVSGNSYTGDKVPIRVNSGEMILNGQQQENLFRMINAGNVNQSQYGTMYAAFSAALNNMQAPVLDYKEFCQFQQKVKLLEKIR